MRKTIHKSLPLAELVEDMDLYPRHAVDMSHVQALVFAMESGANLPAITVDRKSKRITDGWHRARAYKRFLGPEAVVDVNLIDYANEAAMKFDAAERNATHGRRLDAIDRTRCVVMLRAAGFNDSQISTALHVPESRVEKLAVKVATGPKGSRSAAPGTQSIALKRSVAHLAGEKLTKSQVDAHGMLPGTSFLLIARQLSAAIRENMVNLDDEKLVEQLRSLRDLLVEKIR